MSYQVFYWIHIVSYLSWLLAFAASIALTSKVRGARAFADQRKYMRLERLSASVGAHLGAVGILVSGSVMASISSGPEWGWFPFQLYPWLALKQIIFGIILVLVFFSIRRSRAFKQLIGQDGAAEETIINRWSSAYRMSLWVYLLVLVNTFLGLVKPYLLG
jgi:hypothetical protein